MEGKLGGGDDAEAFGQMKIVVAGVFCGEEEEPDGPEGCEKPLLDGAVAADGFFV